jgi:hypothetical protein
MAHKLRFRPDPKRPDLTAEQILDWANRFEARFGRWPMKTDGRRGLEPLTHTQVGAARDFLAPKWHLSARKGRKRRKQRNGYKSKNPWFPRGS